MLPTYEQPDGSRLRAGYTTGTCAAAAAAAAVSLLFTGKEEKTITVDTPSGLTLTLPLVAANRGEGYARAAVRKDAGDDPDVTHGVLVEAEARPLPHGGVLLVGGEGVGRVTRPGLAVPVGEPAINPVPRQQIISAITAVLPPRMGVRVTISVPGGSEIAARTLNPELGIVGGISILGTTGLVEPMSSEAFKRSLLPQLDVAKAAGLEALVLTPGKMGKKNALKLLDLPEEAVIVTSNFIGYMLRACAARGIREAVLFGHVGKLVKVAAGVADTHSAAADARRETLVAHAALAGLPQAALRALMSHNTAEESASFLLAQGWQGVLVAVAEAAAAQAGAMAGGKLCAGCVMLNLRGEIIAACTFARRRLEEWKRG